MKISHVAIILFATIETAQSFSGVSSPTHHNISMHHTRRRGIILSTRMQPTKLYAKKIELTDDTDKEATEATTTSSTTNSEIIILVLPLLLIYISNQWSRYSISYLVDFSTIPLPSSFEAMNIDLQFTQTQYGLLASTAFTILFALTSLIAGDLADDRNNRKILTLGSTTVWSVATLCMSQSHSYNELLFARLIQGGACAFSVPAAYSLIADRVSKDKLSISNGLYGSGVYLGGAVSSLSILLDENIGWRNTLVIVSVYGICSAVVASVILPSYADGDKANGTEKSNNMQQQPDDERGLVTNALDILSVPRIQYLYLASFFRFCSGLLIAIWKAPYFKEMFPNDASEFALINASIMGGVGFASSILGGYIADSLGAWIKETKASSRGAESIIYEIFDEQTIRLLLPIVGSLLAIPTWYYTIHTTDVFEYSMIWLALEYFVAECWFGPTISVLQSTVSKSGTAQGIFVLTGALANIAPTLLGWLYGNQATGTSNTADAEVLGSLLSTGVSIGYLLSAIFFAMSVRADSLPAATSKIKMRQ